VSTGAGLSSGGERQGRSTADKYDEFAPLHWIVPLLEAPRVLSGGAQWKDVRRRVAEL
jgi:hypothetical protein